MLSHIVSDTHSPEADGTNSVTLRKQPGPSVTLRSNEYSCIAESAGYGVQRRTVHTLKVDRIYVVRFPVTPGSPAPGSHLDMSAKRGPKCLSYISYPSLYTLV